MVFKNETLVAFLIVTNFKKIDVVHLYFSNKVDELWEKNRFYIWNIKESVLFLKLPTILLLMTS